MTTRYYAIQECEHGNFRCDEIVPWPVTPDDPGEEAIPRPCPGGVRRELEGVEIVEMRSHRADNLAPGIYGLRPGRYAIIPLPE